MATGLQSRKQSNDQDHLDAEGGVSSGQDSAESGDEVDHESYSTDDDVDEEESPGNRTGESERNVMTFVCEALCDFHGEEKGDLPFRQGEMLTIVGMRPDGWWEAENEEKARGLVPSTFLRVSEKIKKYLEGSQKRTPSVRDKKLWEKLHSTVKQSHNVEEALSALGALPVGFCNPSLSQLLSEDKGYSSETFLAPVLDNSGLNFRDLHWSPHSNASHLTSPRVQRIIRLVAFRQIHQLGAGFDIKSRHVHICLHDGSKVLSNIHTVRANWDSKTPKIWTFHQKVSSGGSCLEEGQFFVRSSSSSTTIGILFQICISFIRVSTGESGEMSCGWVFTRLFDDSGVPVTNRTKVLRVHGGIPFVSKDSTSTPERSGPLKHIVAKSKHPRVVISISSPESSVSQQLNFLPATFVGTVSSLPLLTLYRKILADKLFIERLSADSIELLQSPFLSTFPQVYCQHDLLDAFRTRWNQKSKREKQTLAKDEERKKSLFQETFMESVYVILQCCTLPKYCLGDMEVEQERKAIIAQIMNLIQDHGPLAITLSPDMSFQPISIHNLVLDVTKQQFLPIDKAL